MSSALSALVVYAGQMVTYICEAGDVQPTFPIVHPITEEMLRYLHPGTTPTLARGPSLPLSTLSPASASGDRSSRLQQRARHLERHLLPLMQNRVLLLVIPLSSPDSYREEWARLCFCPAVRVRRLLMLSDTVASGFASGVTSSVVVHASLSTVSICRVKEGSSVRYSNTPVGSVEMLGGPSSSHHFMEQWPNFCSGAVAASSSWQSSREGRKGRDRGGLSDARAMEWTDDGGSSEWLPIEGLVDLTNAEHREAVIRAFGYKAYCAVIVQAQIEAQRRAMKSASSSLAAGDQGKGPSRLRKASLLDELRRVYNRKQRRDPGQVAKLLARVTRGGSSPTSSSLEVGEPCILSGEALAIPFVKDLLQHVVAHLGESTWELVEQERRRSSRKRPRRSLSPQQCSSSPRQCSPCIMQNGAAQGELASPEVTLSGPQPEHGDHSAAANVENAEANSRSSLKKGNEGSHENVEMGEFSDPELASSSGSSSSSVENSEDDAWLYVHPAPLPNAPWWLPLLGGSIVGRLTEKDLQKAVITEEEARDTNGSVVHWKVLL